jgi:WD40 repeat protein
MSLKEARREVSSDGLCAFMEFESDHQKVSFKLHKKIPTHHDSNITCILNLGNKFIATGARNGSIKVYQLSTSHLVAELNEHNDVVTCLSSLNPIYDLDNLILCSGSANLDGRILIWNVFEGESNFVQLKGHSGNITALASLGDGRTIASTAHDGNIILWDSKTGEEIYKGLAHSSMISALRYSPSRNCLISAGWDCNIKIWSIGSSGVEEGFVKKSIHLEKVILSDTPIINILCRQVKGNYVVSIGANNTIKVWNTETGELEGEFLSADNSRAEVCLLENKFKYGKADFITLNTAVKEDIIGGTGTNESFYRTTANSDGERAGYEMSSFFTQPRV